MTTGAFIFFVVFCIFVGLFALFFLHLEDKDKTKTIHKYNHI